MEITMNKKYVWIWSVLIFLTFFQYSHWCFSQNTGEGSQAVEGVEAVPEAEKEKEWWEKAIEYFTSGDPLEEMRALNDELKRLAEDNRRLKEEDENMRNEIQRLMNEIDELKKAQQNDQN